MTSLFVLCAITGGTVLACQFVLTLIGLGGDHGGFADHADVDDLVSGGDDFHSDVASPDGHDAGHQHGSTWLFGVISFRTLVAATTFFGLCGLAAESLRMSQPVQVLVGLAGGVGAMYAVHGIMRLFGRLTEDGTVRIRRAIGSQATVYLPIPAAKSGAGKIHLTLQDRLMEYAAVTANGERLPAGAKVVVVDIVGSDTLEVAPYGEPVETA